MDNHLISCSVDATNFINENVNTFDIKWFKFDFILITINYYYPLKTYSFYVKFVCEICSLTEQIRTIILFNITIYIKSLNFYVKFVLFY